MRIAIDLDDTISCTKEEINYNLSKYLKDNNIKEDEITREVIKEFLDIYAYDLLKEANIKEDASKYINMLQEDNEIYIITARSNDYTKCIKDAYKLSEEWLNKYNIYPKDIFINVNGESKAKIAKENNIDIAIDDDINNINWYNKYNIESIHFNNKSWKEIYEYIRNRME